MLRKDIQEFDVDVERLIQVLKQAIPAYEADRVDLQNWRRRSSYAKDVQRLADSLRPTLAAWQELPETVRQKVEEPDGNAIDKALASAVENFELFAELHQEVRGNPGLASDNNEIEIAPLEWLILELAEIWPESRFGHDALIIREHRIAEPTGRFLKFVDAVTQHTLSPRPSIPTLSALIRKIKPKLAARRTT